MDLKLGDKIRSLRRGRGISQEVLAAYLGVSFQAVSKWENGSAMPDITLIPSIASFFSVTTDELFSFNLFQTEKNVEEIVNEHSKYYYSDPEKAVEIIREGLKKYPGNEILLNCLVGVLSVPENADEVINTCHALIETAKSEECRIDAYRILAEAYDSIGEKSAVKDALNHIPEIYFTALEMKAILLDGNERFEAAAKQKSLSLDELCHMLFILAEHYIEANECDKAKTELEIALEILNAFKKENFNTPWTQVMYEAYGERIIEIENKLKELS
ncbi:MAG: helix-turn-helix domain-containing protein [Eubacteriales bacterium]